MCFLFQNFFRQPIDETKEDFRVYLAKNGVLDALTKVLAKVQEFQPENPLEVRCFNMSEKFHLNRKFGFVFFFLLVSSH